MGARGNRSVVSKERWARSVRPRLRQRPRAVVIRRAHARSPAAGARGSRGPTGDRRSVRGGGPAGCSLPKAARGPAGTSMSMAAPEFRASASHALDSKSQSRRPRSRAPARCFWRVPGDSAALLEIPHVVADDPIAKCQRQRAGDRPEQLQRRSWLTAARKSTGRVLAMHAEKAPEAAHGDKNDANHN